MCAGMEVSSPEFSSASQLNLFAGLHSTFVYYLVRIPDG